MNRMKKVLIFFGILGATAYLFRDQIFAGALALTAKANRLSISVGERLLAANETEDDDVFESTIKEN